MRRARVKLKGAVQGVGFRPFVYRIAKELGLKGYVINDSRGVEIEVEGEEELLHKFLLRLSKEKPPLARIYSREVLFLEPIGYKDFEIRKSNEEGEKEVLILPDISTCEDCLRELFDPKDRRYRYPFINCTNCGPRFTIIEKLPYDRKNTTMKVFKMCEECEREYKNPLDRRFHAQPNACPKCGPHVTLYDNEGNLIARREEALEKLVRLIREGKIVAVKGIGGFHLVCDATNEEAVRELRKRKRRKEKPFAVMFRDLKQVEEYANPTELEKALLLSPERPIVLIEKKKELAPSVAPYLRRVGAFLPYSPLHHLILSSLDFPVVATSGNLSDEPIVKDNEEAFEKLSELSDFILLHNRDIKRRCDDSVVKVVGGIPTFIRRSRGYAPLPVELPLSSDRKVLAVGGMLKNTFAIAFGNKAFPSQHIGDIDSITNLKAFEREVYDFMKLYEFEPDVIVCDMHPRYETTRWAVEFARERGIKLVKVQHHYAHILSCMAENKVKEKVLGIAWDGTGYGEDGTLWGGEFLVCDYRDYERAFYFKPFRLIGGEKAVKEPRRVALSLLFELFGDKALGMELPTLKAFSEKELENLFKVWKRGINSPLSSSVGRLFDAVSSLLGIRQVLSYEGQGAMMIEDLYDHTERGFYPYTIKEGKIFWEEIISALIEERDPRRASTRFINTLARICLDIAKEIGIPKVCLSGGVMQNDPLVSKIKELLEEEGFKVFTHQKVSPNDSGLCVGQAVYGMVMSL
ncbi:carbamoyltransferase HypF [Aquifex pyrophilus]